MGDVACPRGVFLKLISGDPVMVSLDNGTTYPMSLIGLGDPTLFGLDSQTTNLISCIADANGSLGGKYFVVNDLHGPVWVWLDTGTGAGTYAEAVLTSDQTEIVSGATVTIGSKTYTFRSISHTLTATAIPVNNDTVTIGTATGTPKTYTFLTTLTGADGEVLIGASTATALTNFYNAINLTGVAGTDYGAAMTLNADVVATGLTATTVVVTTVASGPEYFGLVTTETSATLSWAATTAGPTVEGDVYLGQDPDEALMNLSRAVNHSGTPDVDYKCAAVHPSVLADAVLDAHSLTFTANALGAAGNGLATNTSSTGTILEFGSTVTLGGLEPSIAPVVTTQRLLRVVIVANSAATAIADAVSLVMDADPSFSCANPPAAILTIADVNSGPRTAISAGTSGFTSPSSTFTGPATVKLLSRGTSQVVVAVAPA